MPKRASTEAIIKYNTDASIQLVTNAGQKPYAAAKHCGHQQEIYQKVASICEAPSRVRRFPPQPDDCHDGDQRERRHQSPNAGLRLEMSDTMAAINPESAALVTK
jgi:hypothetical protein